MLFYYITDRTQFAGNEEERYRRVLEQIAEAARCGIDFIQLREKDLATRDLAVLGRAAIEKIRFSGSKTRLLINSRTDVALAVGADGVHLRSRDVSPDDVRDIWRKAGQKTKPVIAVSCHTEAEIVAAKTAGADFVVFGPVFQKKDAATTGLDKLRTACSIGIPVLALGGITAENAALCVQMGAAGVSGIRLFQTADLSQTVQQLCSY